MSADYVIPTSAARTVAPVTTFKGKEETQSTIDRLLAQALAAARKTDRD